MIGPVTSGPEALGWEPPALQGAFQFLRSARVGLGVASPQLDWDRLERLEIVSLIQLLEGQGACPGLERHKEAESGNTGAGMLPFNKNHTDPINPTAIINLEGHSTGFVGHDLMPARLDFLRSTDQLHLRQVESEWL